MSKIPLGSHVKDKVTGLVGVVDNRASFLYGVDRYCIQPPAKEDGSVPESMMVDEPQLEILDKPSAVTPQPEPEQIVQLGSWVEDPIRGKKGTATGRAVYVNGCARILIEPKQKGRFRQDLWWAPEPQIRVLKGSQKVPLKEPGDPTSRRGGPAPANSKY